MGRILVYADSPTGREIRSFFPFAAAGGAPRQIASTIRAFFDAARHTTGAIAQLGDLGHAGAAGRVSGTGQRR